jgi:hypothetical protein
LFQPYIGELWIASTSDSVFKDQTNMEELEALSEEEREEILNERMAVMQAKSELQQSLRQLKCAQNLRTRIADFDENNQEPFLQQAREEAIKIAQGAYGSLYLNTIGFSLAVSAEEFLGFERSFLGLKGHVARSRKNASNIGTNFKLLGAGLKAAGAGSRAMHEAEKLQKDGEEVNEQAAEMMADTIGESLPAFLELAWAINKRDIQVTLHEVCKKLFQDASVPKDMRLIRAKAVKKLGLEFQAVGKASKATAKANFSPEDIKARVAVAAMTTMAKAQGQEITEQDQEDMIRKAKEMGLDQQDQAEWEDLGEDFPSSDAAQAASAKDKKVKAVPGVNVSHSAAKGQELD